MKITRQVALVPVLFALLAPVSRAEPRPELKLTRLVFATSSQEMSGLAPAPRGLWTVADDAEDHYIYRIDVGSKAGRLKLEPAVDLTKLQGYDAYVKELKDAPGVPDPDRRLDLEGVAVCGDELYLVNERVRHVLIVDLKARTLRRAPVTFDRASELGAILWKGESNAGFEAVAADCAGQRIYLGKERDPRHVVVLDRQTWAVVGDFDVKGSDRTGQRVINPFTGEGLFDIGPDFADLTFDGDALYALERSAYEIAKIDPKTRQVIARVSYLKTERGLYETGEPFGIAEGLTLTKDAVIVSFDNNRTPISGAAAKAHGVKGDFGAVAVFARPPGF